MTASTIDRSPSGSWRAELERRAHRPAICATCRRAVCDHTDDEYRGHSPKDEEPRR